MNVRTRRCEKDLKLIPLEEFQTVQIWIKGSLKERKEMTETWCFLIIISYTKFRSECLVRRYWIGTSKQWLPIWWFRSDKNLKNLFFTLSFCANEKFYIYIVSISFIFVFSIEKFRFHICMPIYSVVETLRPTLPLFPRFILMYRIYTECGELRRPNCEGLTLWLQRWSYTTGHGFSCDVTVVIVDLSASTSYDCTNCMKIDS